MAMQYDVWAIKPSTNDALLRASASIAGAGPITLLTDQVAINGCGYKIVFTSASDESATTYTVTGVKVGQLDGITTEVVTGPDTTPTTATTVNYYTKIISIVASAASVGSVKIGTTGSLALPRCRVKGLYYVGAANAGSIVISSNSPTGPVLLEIDTPGSATVVNSLYMAAEGILTARSGVNDFAVVTLTEITKATLICG